MEANELNSLRKQNADLLLALREVAGKATPGPWRVGSFGGRCEKATHSPGRHPGPRGNDPCVYTPDFMEGSQGIAGAETMVVSATYDGVEISEGDAEFIATANPAAIQSLLDYIAALEANAAQSAPASAPGAELTDQQIIDLHDAMFPRILLDSERVMGNVVKFSRALLDMAGPSRASAGNSAGLDERADFEAWLRSRWPNAVRPIDEKTITGSYAFTENNLLWETWQARAALASAPAEKAARQQVQLGVIEFHTTKNDALREQFYMVVDDLRAAGCIVDVWLMDIASVLKKHGYSMEIYRGEADKAAAADAGGQS